MSKNMAWSLYIIMMIRYFLLRHFTLYQTLKMCPYNTPLNKSFKNFVKKSKIIYIVGMKVEKTQNGESTGVQRNKGASTIEAKRKEIKQFQFILFGGGGSSSLEIW